MVKAEGTYLLATGSDTDWTNVLSDWDFTFSLLADSIHDISGLPLQDDVSLNRNTNFTKIDISANSPSLRPFRAYMVDISGLIDDYTKFYMTEDASGKIHDIYVDDILGKTSYDTDICANQIKAVTMAQAVTSIAERAFSGLPELKRANIPKTVTEIGSNAFYECSNLSGVTFEAGSLISFIGISAFQKCSSLSTVTIPKSLTIMGNYAFQDCSGLSTIIFESDSSLSIIGYNSFQNTNLKQITIPKSVSEIWTSAFEYCSNLLAVTFEANSQLTSIGSSAFKGVSDLISVTIPSGVTSIGQQAFIDCSKLSHVTFTGDMIPPDISSNTFPPKSQDITAYYTQYLSPADIDILEATFQYVHGPPKTLFTLKNNNFKVIDISGSLSDSSYSNDISLNDIISVMVGTNVTTIGNAAFYQATNLTSVTIPASVTSIGQDAFLDSSLNTVYMTEPTSSQLGLPTWYNYSISPPVGPDGQQPDNVLHVSGLNNYSFFGATVNIYNPESIIID